MRIVNQQESNLSGLYTMVGAPIVLPFTDTAVTSAVQLMSSASVAINVHTYVADCRDCLCGKSTGQVPLEVVYTHSTRRSQTSKAHCNTWKVHIHVFHCIGICGSIDGTTPPPPPSPPILSKLTPPDVLVTHHAEDQQLVLTASCASSPD